MKRVAVPLALAAIALSAAAGPGPGPATKIDLTRSGTYTSGKWEYRLVVTQPGTRSEGRAGTLRHGGKPLPKPGTAAPSPDFVSDPRPSPRAFAHLLGCANAHGADLTLFPACRSAPSCKPLSPSAPACTRLEPTGHDPATSWLQTRCSPS